MAEMINKWAVVDKLTALENEFQHYKPFEGFEHAMYRKVCELEIAIGKTPGVEVVRCKDCKHYDNSEGICWCHLNSKFYPGGFDWHSFPEDGFCSYGERRTDEKTD